MYYITMYVSTNRFISAAGAHSATEFYHAFACDPRGPSGAKRERSGKAVSSSFLVLGLKASEGFTIRTPFPNCQVTSGISSFCSLTYSLFFLSSLLSSAHVHLAPLHCSF